MTAMGATTPNLDQLAAEGIVMEQAISPAPWTLPAHVSLFNSQLPDEHRVRRVESRVQPHHLLLSECFRNAGYRTALISAQNENWQGMRRFLLAGSRFGSFYHALDAAWRGLP